jgi:pyruvate dehydrogenase E2 component (dihydrolipoyllysine-residue acetyltransferase)
MITKVVLAKLSPTMEEGTIVKWNKKEGDAVKQGDVLAEIETDKANMEMEALGSGVLRRILVPAGGKAPVGSLIGVIADPNEDIAKILATASAPAPAAAQPPAPAPGPDPASPAPPAAPAATASAAPAPAPAPQPAPAHVEPAAAAQAGPEGRVKASPLARSMAAQHNIPLASITGSGPGGRIIKRDVESWGGTAAGPARPAAAAPAARPAPARAPEPTVRPGEVIPLSNMRRTIARRLSESMFSAPHFYVTVEIAMDRAVELRQQLIDAQDMKVSYNDLVVKACALALRRFPTVNASWGEDKIVTHPDVNVGVAVAMAEGLIVPVVRNADRKSVIDISREVKELAGRARDRKLKPEEFSGGTFTVSNLGMFDVTEFTAIINPPESAILAVGAVQAQPVVVDGQVRPGHRMRVTQSSDHRVIDGALAAQFLAEVRRLLENPITLFLS